ncbi:MAG: DUF3326 domain-containing protein, partial [Planctomycetes bacterium]|nr:DUF3326 domain-containing protein [Planctomycetota bacterium]
GSYACEVGYLIGSDPAFAEGQPSIFAYRQRSGVNVRAFNAVYMVPTGIGAEVGGHAGDASPAAQLLASCCDQLITHPNVVNASDINEMPESALYVEGSVLNRFLMGTVGLQPVRSNRVLVVIDAHRDEAFVNVAINSVSGARAAYGLNCPEVVCLDPPVKLRARFASSGRAAGRVESLDALFAILRERRTDYDAVALSSVIDVPNAFHLGYFEAAGEMINPWGGVEAMLTHATSSLFNVPTAHSPMFESQTIANLDPGIVDPRMAAEAVSMTFLQCILKGLQRSPRIITSPDEMRMPGVLTAEDVHCLVIPDGCLGLPVIAALEQGIAVIAVCENSNRMSNNLSVLPWRSGQFFRVDNYWEAAGVIAALRAGITPDSVRRPLAATSVSIVKQTQEHATLSVPQRENDRSTSQ